MLTHEEKKARKREYDRKYREVHKERLREYMQTYTATNKEKLQAKDLEVRRKRALSGYSVLKNTESRCRKNGTPFNLTKEYVDSITPTHCPILGYLLVRQVGKVGASYNSPSIDRIVPSKGYIIGNVQIISNKANTMKSNATPEELLMFANWILNQRS